MHLLPLKGRELHTHVYVFCWIMATAPVATPTTLPTSELRFSHDEAALPGAASNVRHANNQYNAARRYCCRAALQLLLASEVAQRQLAAANSTPPNPPVPATTEAQRAALGTVPSALEPANHTSGTTLPAAGAPPLQPAMDGERQLAAATHPATSFATPRRRCQRATRCQRRHGRRTNRRRCIRRNFHRLPRPSRQ